MEGKGSLQNGPSWFILGLISSDAKMADRLLTASVIPFVVNFILIVSSLTLLIVYYFKRKYSYWQQRGIPYAKPSFFFGNIKDMTLKRIPPAFMYQKLYKELEGHKFAGFYQITKPTLLVRDPELIKCVFVKNFIHFQDKATYLNESLDPLTAHLSNLKGQRWRNVRSKLSPAFSSKKLRSLHDSIKDCIAELDKHLTKITSADSKTGGEQNLRELLFNLTTDIMGSCDFGVRCNAIQDENSEFGRVKKLFLKFNQRSFVQNLLIKFSPWLVHMFNVKRHNPEIDQFFKSVIHEAIKHRDTDGHKRTDFLQIMLNLQAEEQQQLQNKGSHQPVEVHGKRGNDTSRDSTEKSSGMLFTDNVVISNAYLFFAAGFETNALTLSYCLYELALNPDVREKITAEVDKVRQAHSGRLDYDALKELKYMDAVISESQRKYTLTAFLRRRCTVPFQIPGTSFVLEKGTDINVPLYAIHHDPKHFSDPDTFLPERFSEGNKNFIKPGTFMPFGDGPRMCIGLRFAQLGMKSVLSYILSNYTVHPCEKTAVPLRFNCESMLLTPTTGIWIRFQRRPK